MGGASQEADPGYCRVALGYRQPDERRPDPLRIEQGALRAQAGATLGEAELHAARIALVTGAGYQAQAGKPGNLERDGGRGDPHAGGELAHGQRLDRIELLEQPGQVLAQPHPAAREPLVAAAAGGVDGWIGGEDGVHGIVEHGPSYRRYFDLSNQNSFVPCCPPGSAPEFTQVAMIRLFAAATSDPVIRRNAATAASLALHGLVLALLLVPVGVAVKQGLFEHLVVYLVPPDKPAGDEHSLGDAPFAAVASDAGAGGQQGAPAAREATDPDVIVTRGDVPLMGALELVAASRPRAEDNAMTELEVDSAVVRDPTSAAPDYPPALLRRGFEGSAAVLYVVDTLGGVDTLTYRVIAASHPDFAVAVRRALPEMRFRPAIQRGHRVRQLVQQTFRFRIVPRDTLRAPQPQHPTA